MPVLNETVRGVAWVALANVVTKLLWAATTVVLLHSLNPATYGWLATVWATAFLFASVSDWGAGQAMLRFASKHQGEERDLLIKALAIKSAAFVPLVIVLTWLLSQVWNTPATWLAAWILMLIAVAGQFVDSYQQLFTYACQIIRRLDLFAIGRTAYFLGLFIGILLAARQKEALFFVALAQLVASTVFIAWFARAVTRLLPPGKPSTAGYQDMLRWGRMFFLSTLLNLAYYRIDIMILAGVAGKEATGNYSAQYQLILLLYSVPGMLFSVIVPDLYRHRAEHGFLQNAFDRLCRYLNLLAVIAMPLLTLYSRDIMALLGGAEYVESHASLKILAGFALLLPAAVALNLLTITDRLPLRWVSDSLGIAVTAILGWYLAAHWGVSGMAVGAVAGYAAAGAMAMALIAFLEGISLQTYLRDLSRMGIGALPALMLVMLLPWPAWVGALAYAGTFFITLTVTGFWDDGDRRLMHSLVQVWRQSKAS